MSARPSPTLLEQLVELLAVQLAPRIADELAARTAPVPPINRVGASELITLDELVAELPKAKSAATWRRWLYSRLPAGNVPGAVKLGGTWFFDMERVRVWIEGGRDR